MDEIRKLLPNMEKPSTPAQQQKLMEFLLSKGIDMRNSYQELEMSSRYADTHRDSTFSNSTVQLHSHNFYEIICCTNTCGAEYLVGTRRYRLQKGDIVFVSPGISHRPILPEQMTEPYKRDVLWISSEFMEQLVTHSPELQKIPPSRSDLIRTTGTQWEFLADLFRFGVREYEAQRIGWESSILGNTMTILVLLARAFIDPNTYPLRAEMPNLLDRVMAYIEENFSRRITLCDVARHFFVSTSTISHLFKEKMGVSFYGCVTQRRLIHAKVLIAEGVSLETVAVQSGFTDYSTFYRAFRQEYGISPRQFRKLQT